MPESLVAPELVWGLIPRFVGALYIVAFASLIPQIDAFVGSRGVLPIAPTFARARRDYPGFRRFFDTPSLLWLWSSDRALHVMLWAGVLSGAVCVYGGPVAPFGHAAAWFLWLSLDPAWMIFPWDTMLQEAGFLALFLPSVEPLPSLEASSLPFPAVAFVFRWFVLRLMLGFGKLKFVGTKREDALYLRGFFVWMPSPTPLAWFGHHLPAWMLRNMLYFMFVAEVIAPLLGLFSGPLRLVSFALLSMLMIGIQATGNWGYFNIGYIMLCTCLLDTSSSILDLGAEPWLSTLWDYPQLALNPLMALMFLTGLVYLVVFDSWTTRTVIRWPWDRFTWNRRLLRAFVGYLRAILPFRIINGYGVFPPGANPPLRIMPVFEGSDDGVTWRPYRFPHMPSSPEHRPRFVAPYHPRIDMAAYYAASSGFDGTLFGSLTGEGRPYTSYARASWLDRLGQRLLNGEPTPLRLLGDASGVPPKLVRVSALAMTPTHPDVRRATGAWWHTRRLGLLVPARGKEDWVEALSVSEPEGFHPDWVDDKRRSAPIKAITRAFLAGVEPNRAILTDSDLTEADVRSFWDEFLPCVNDGRGDFARHAEKAQQVIQRFGRLTLARHERILERFAWLLRLRTERHQFADAQPKLPIESNFRYHMFLQELVMDGQSAYESYLSDVALVVKRLEQSSDARQLWTLTMCRYDLMMAHVGGFRWTSLGRDSYKLKIPGLFEYYPLLRECVPPGEELVPQVVKLPTGEHTVEGFYPPPKLSGAQTAE